MMSDSATQEQVIAGRYRLVKRLGTGGMSVVMLAQDSVLQRVVAIKLLAEHLASDQDFITRFRHEAIAVARLQHPNIVQIYDSGIDESSRRHYIVMEFVDGTPLSELIVDEHTIEPARAVEIASDACEALECAHRAGIVHRDVKPANLIIARDGTTKLMDFGIAKAAEQTRVTQVGSVLGTVAYLAPEQAVGGDTGPASDIYSLAVCVYQMLSGRLPFEYKSITELAMKQRDQSPPPLTQIGPEISVELDRAVRVGLAHDPTLRYRSTREFSAALRAGLARRESEFVTLALSDPEAATRILNTPARSPGFIPAANNARRPLPPRAVADAAATAQANARSPRNRGAKRFAALILLITAIGAAAFAGTTLTDSGSSPVLKKNIDQQIEGLRQLIKDNS